MIRVVNMIPASLSSEIHQDSEPNISVNPSNPLQIAASAFTPDTAHPGKAPIYVSTDGGKTATIDLSLDSRAASPSFTRVRLEKRTTLGQDGFQIRIAIHPSGVIYAAFYGWRSQNSSGIVTADVVIVRDDNWGSGGAP